LQSGALTASGPTAAGAGTTAPADTQDPDSKVPGSQDPDSKAPDSKGPDSKGPDTVQASRIIDQFVREHLLAADSSTEEPAARTAREGRFFDLLLMLLTDGRGEQATGLCQNPQLHLDSATIGSGLATALTLTSATEEVGPQAEPLLERVLQENPENANVLISIGALRDKQNRTDEAISLYRKALALDPDRPEALNNLAMILANQPQSLPEARELIDKAISQSGPLAWLLDTQAVVKLYAGDAQAALPLLLQVVAELPNEAGVHLHLAMAYQKLGDMTSARPAYQQAKALGIASSLMTQCDRRMWLELNKKLDLTEPTPMQ
jgi:tetratricopeptide (TPR) repeat protein